MSFYKYESNQNLTYLYIKVKANAKENSFDDSIKLNNIEYLNVRIKALPIEGKANEAIISFLAKTLNVKKSDLKIVRGETSNLKKISITGNNVAGLLALL